MTPLSTKKEMETKDILPVPHPTLVSAITSNVKTKPKKVFLKWVSSKNQIQQTRTYSEVYEQSMRVAHLLLLRGVKRGDRVMIAYPFGLEFVSGLVGCMMVGVIGCSVSNEYSALSGIVTGNLNRRLFCRFTHPIHLTNRKQATVSSSLTTKSKTQEQSLLLQQQR